MDIQEIQVYGKHTLNPKTCEEGQIMDLDKLENRMVIDAYWDDNDTDLLDDYEEYDPVEYAERMEYLYDKVEDLV